MFTIESGMMEKLEKDLEEILDCYKQLNKKGVDKWLEDIDPETDWIKLQGVTGPIDDSYAGTRRKCAYNIGTCIKNIHDNMKLLKAFMKHEDNLYKDFCHLKYNPKSNPNVIKWLTDYETDHPEALDNTTSELHKICPVCSKEFSPKTTRGIYCSKACYKKKAYAQKNRQVGV